MEKVLKVLELIKVVGVEDLKRTGHLQGLIDLGQELVKETAIETYLADGNPSVIWTTEGSVILVGKEDSFTLKSVGEVKGTVNAIKVTKGNEKTLSIDEAMLLGWEACKHFILGMYPEINKLNVELTEQEFVTPNTTTSVVADNVTATITSDIENITTVVVGETEVEKKEEVTEEVKTPDVKPTGEIRATKISRPKFKATQSTGTVVVDGVEIPKMFANNTVAKEDIEKKPSSIDISEIVSGAKKPVVISAESIAAGDEVKGEVDTKKRKIDLSGYSGNAKSISKKEPEVVEHKLPMKSIVVRDGDELYVVDEDIYDNAYDTIKSMDNAYYIDAESIYKMNNTVMQNEEGHELAEILQRMVNEGDFDYDEKLKENLNDFITGYLG